MDLSLSNDTRSEPGDPSSPRRRPSNHSCSCSALPEEAQPATPPLPQSAQLHSSGQASPLRVSTQSSATSEMYGELPDLGGALDLSSLDVDEAGAGARARATSEMYGELPDLGGALGGFPGGVPVEDSGSSSARGGANSSASSGIPAPIPRDAPSLGSGLNASGVAGGSGSRGSGSASSQYMALPALDAGEPQSNYFAIDAVSISSGSSSHESGLGDSPPLSLLDGVGLAPFLGVWGARCPSRASVTACATHLAALSRRAKAEAEQHRQALPEAPDVGEMLAHAAVWAEAAARLARAVAPLMPLQASSAAEVRSVPEYSISISPSEKSISDRISEGPAGHADFDPDAAAARADAALRALSARGARLRRLRLKELPPDAGRALVALAAEFAATLSPLAAAFLRVSGLLPRLRALANASAPASPSDADGGWPALTGESRASSAVLGDAALAELRRRCGRAAEEEPYSPPRVDAETAERVARWRQWAAALEHLELLEEAEARRVLVFASASLSIPTSTSTSTSTSAMPKMPPVPLHRAWLAAARRLGAGAHVAALDDVFSECRAAGAEAETLRRALQLGTRLVALPAFARLARLARAGHALEVPPRVRQLCETPGFVGHLPPADCVRVCAAEKANQALFVVTTQGLFSETLAVVVGDVVREVHADREGYRVDGAAVHPTMRDAARAVAGAAARAAQAPYLAAPWFFAGVPTPLVAEMMEGAPIGQFLIRFSSSANSFASSFINKKGALQHSRLFVSSNGGIEEESSKASWPSLEEMVAGLSHLLVGPMHSENAAWVLECRLLAQHQPQQQ